MRPSQLRPSIMSPEGLALLERESLKGQLASRSRTPEPELRPLMASVRTVSRLTIQLIIAAEDTKDRAAMDCAIRRQLAARSMELHIVLDYGD